VCGEQNNKLVEKSASEVLCRRRYFYFSMKYFTFSSILVHYYTPDFSSYPYSHLEFSIDLHSDLEIDEHDQFALWISFAEIYNEQIFDLLEPLNVKEKKRTVLKLGDDKNGNPYIKGKFCGMICLICLFLLPITFEPFFQSKDSNMFLFATLKKLAR
jgi:hypothetical protein